MTTTPLFQLQIGTLSKVNQPAFVPYNGLSAVLFKHEQTSQTSAYELCEAIILQLLQKQANAQVLLFEAYPSAYFSQLKRLFAQTEQHYGAQLLTVREFGQHTTKLTELAHQRFSLLASTHSDTLFSYNAQTKRPEKIIYLLLTDINPLAGESSLLQTLQHLCLQAPQVGIVPILLRNKSLEIAEEPSDFKRKAQQSFWQIVENQVFGFDLTQNPIKGFQQPAELWRLFDKFNLSVGMNLALRKQWTDALANKLKLQEENNPHTDFLKIPIGMEGAKTAYFCLGEASNNYHGMIGGATRSGKSTLLNNLILKLCETYHPDELRLWLFDYKHGVEFSIFAGLAHLDALHVDNEQPDYATQAFAEFEGLMKQRTKLFRSCQPPVSNIKEYNLIADKPLPRCLLIIDEVQVLFENRDTKKEAQQLLKSISRLGAGYGLHLLLSTQSYRNVDLDEAAKGQFHLRIGLKLANSMECRALMGRDNDELLNLPRYHAIYNNDCGEAANNRMVALDDLPKAELWQRLQALKQRYPQSKPAFDFASSEKTEPLKTKPTDDFSDWDDLK